MASNLLQVLESRFEANSARHPDLRWDDVAPILGSSHEAISVLERMEATGGEPDVVCSLGESNVIVFVDCAAESPSGRRSLCYDRAAWLSRKANKPRSSAESVAAEIGVTLLDEREYSLLQSLGEFDRATSSWLMTPADVRDLGGALFGDRRFGRVFTYHNGAESYYASRGFRGKLVLSR